MSLMVGPLESFMCSSIIRAVSSVEAPSTKTTSNFLWGTSGIGCSRSFLEFGQLHCRSVQGLPADYYILSQSQYAAWQSSVTTLASSVIAGTTPAGCEPLSNYLTASSGLAADACASNVLIGCGPYSSIYAPSDGIYYYVFYNSGPSATVTFVAGLSTGGDSSVDFGTAFGIAALVIVGVLVVLLLLRRRSRLPPPPPRQKTDPVRLFGEYFW